MSNIPDSWPPTPDGIPADDTPTSVVAPVFVLPSVLLFPGQVLPLHVFEPRYRAMVQDGLDGPGRIVVAGVVDERVPDESPLRRTAGLGEIARHESLPDGRYLIWLGGIARVRIEEVPSERPYRLARCEVVREIAPPAEKREALRQALISALVSRLDKSLEFGGGELPIGLLTDLLSQCVPMPPLMLESLFEDRDVARRAERALDAHARYPDRVPGDEPPDSDTTSDD